MILIITYIPNDQHKSASPEEWRGMTEHVSSIDGLFWKYWLKENDSDYYGRVYLFESQGQAEVGGAGLKASLTEAGARDISLRFFEVDAELSAVTRGILPQVG